MKKAYITLILASTFLFGFGQTTLIPDPNFEQALIDLGLDATLDGSVLNASISVVSQLNVSNKSISDLTGIEAFTSLTNLVCHSNQLTNLDVSQNIGLSLLWCEVNQLTSLDVSQNTALLHLNCYANQLTSLDVTLNPFLTHLDCRNNQLTNLGVALNPFLTHLDCRNNQLTHLDVAQNNLLEILDCSTNQLTDLDVTLNTALGVLVCSGNQLTNIDVTQNVSLTHLNCDNNQLTRLAVAQNIALISLDCSYNQLTCLNVKNGNNSDLISFYSDNNPDLTCIEVDDVVWSTYSWINIDTVASFSELCGNACSFFSQGFYPTQDICLVSVDPITNKNKIVWERQNIFDADSLLIDSFYVYRYISGAYAKIGGVSFDDETEFVDNSSGVVPGTAGYRYKISVLDSYGAENDLGDFHKTIHLQVLQGASNEHNLFWTDYEGFVVSNYRILRDDSATGGWNTIDSVGFGITSYTDSTPPSASSKYVIEAVHPNGCDVTRKIGVTNSTWSNIVEGETAEISTNSIQGFSLFPNPTSSSIILTNLTIGGEIDIYNALGQKVYASKVTAVSLSINLTELGDKGVYFVRVKNHIARVLLID